MAFDIGVTFQQLPYYAYGFIEDENILRKIKIWLHLASKAGVQTYGQNMQAVKCRRILEKRLVKSFTESILIRDVIATLIAEHIVDIGGITNFRMYTIIVCNYPTEEYSDGERIVGYHLLSEEELINVR